MSLPDLEEHAGIVVVRDDRTPGGTKARLLPELFARWPEPEFVFGGPAEGYAQVAMGYAAAATGKRATYFVAARRQRHFRTVEAEVAGARIVEVEHGRLNVVQARARAYAREAGARFLPLGFDVPEALALVAALARQLPYDPEEVWCVAGAGLLSRGLQAAWPRADHHAVRIGMPPNVGRAKLWEAPEPFSRDAERPPPFPSCSNYDAKAWQFIAEHARPGALFWNVAA
jgi:hypothetical protein